MNAVIDRAVEHVSSIEIIPYHPKFLWSALEVAEEIHKTSIFANFPFDSVKLIAQLSMAGTVQSKERYFRLAVRGERVLGGFYGMVMPVFFCDAIVAKDIGWWVREEARGGRTALLLLKDFENWAVAQGARKIGLGQTGVSDIERTRKLFEHCGYSVVGYNAMKDI